MTNPAAHRLRTKKDRMFRRHMRRVRRLAPGLDSWQGQLIRSVVGSQGYVRRQHG